MTRHGLDLPGRVALVEALASLCAAADVTDDNECQMHLDSINEQLDTAPDYFRETWPQNLRWALNLPQAGREPDLPTQNQEEANTVCGGCSAVCERPGGGRPDRLWCMARRVWVEVFETCRHFEAQP